MSYSAPRPVLADVSVVIPTLGRDMLEGCLRSIADGNAWPARLIVVDQGSNPAVVGWMARAESCGMACDHVRSAQRGAAAARNRGVERVLTRFVAATDDDCRVAPDWLERMRARLHEDPDAFVTGRVEALGTASDGSVPPSLIDTPTSEVHSRPLLERDPLFSNNMGFARAVADRIGPMDERACVRFAEDAEWSYRALRTGVRIVYAPDVVVGHVAWRDATELASTYGRYARSQGAFYATYLRRGDGFIALRAALDLARGPWFLARGLATRNRELAAIGRAYITQLPAGILDGLRAGPREPGEP